VAAPLRRSDHLPVGGDQSQEQRMEETDRASEVGWGYEGETGPDHWGGLDPCFALCDSGSRQSPVDLANAIPAAASDTLDIRWQPADACVLDTGHTVQVDVAEGSFIVLEGREFSLTQFHFHLPSEHTVGGARYALEAHFVHVAAAGDLAVIGTFIEIGEKDVNIQRIWEAIPAYGESPVTLSGFNPATLLPRGRVYARYTGSLTTPPCSEVVHWVVMVEPTFASQAQVDLFSKLHPPNARPVQPLNGRTITLHGSSTQPPHDHLSAGGT